ncbi:DUF6223 family protein [Streptomyces sp. NPDC001276]|uniref:DUF6223 family protein n=1 Tax=Streptomyces sp. NPDC001276 TaxID=3364555 RepID=UPI00367844A1
MSVRFVLAAAAAHGSAQLAAVYSVTTGRLVGGTAALVALAGVVIGGLALTRPAGRAGAGNRRSRALVAVVAGLFGMVVGALNLAVADGGPGTGNGVVGGAMALVLGLIAAVLGRLALARSRRTAQPADRLTG